jgi:hypothetical protein
MEIRGTHNAAGLVRRLGQVPLFQGLAADVLARVSGQAPDRPEKDWLIDCDIAL